MSSPVNMSIGQMREAAKLGAYLELVWVRPGTDAARAYVNAIRAVGSESIVLSSDLGQAANPLHPDGLLAMYQYLASQGVPTVDIDRMAKTNPAKLLGLKP